MYIMEYLDLKNQLLEPLNTILRLTLLYFKPLKSKIGIFNHAIFIDEPSIDRSLTRYMNGDKREHISFLYDSITRFIKWYLLEDHPNISELREIGEYCCLGLKKLQQTYGKGNVVLTLQYYINILKDSIENNFEDELLPEHYDNDSNLLDYDKIKNFWSEVNIIEIHDLLKKCFQATDKDNIESYVLAIDHFIVRSENHFRESVIHNNIG